METLMSNKFIFTASAPLLSRTLELTNVTKVAIDILPVHSLVSKKMAEVGKIRPNNPYPSIPPLIQE